MQPSEEIWWERVRRAAKRQGRAGSKVMSDWARDVLPVVSPDPAELAQYEKLGPAAVAERGQMIDGLANACAAVHQHPRDALDVAVDQHQRPPCGLKADSLVGQPR